MDCVLVFSFFFIILLNEGLQTDGQVLTLCKDPLLSTRCTLQCSRRAANESVLLYKETSMKIECGEDNICSKPDAIYADSSNANSVKFHILKLGYADRANWTCKSGGRSGRTRELQVYSFKDENVAYDMRSISSRRHNVTVTIECVMPIPEIHVGFCDEQICRGKGKPFFNGPCADSGIETHRQFNCIIDLNHRGARCHLKEEPIQISLFMDDRKVYSTKTNEVFSYGYAPNCSVRIIPHDNCSREPPEPRENPKCVIQPDTKVQCQSQMDSFMVGTIHSTAGFLISFLPTIAVSYIVYICIRYCRKRKGYVKKSTNIKKEVPEKRPNYKETSRDAEGKCDAGDQEAFDMETQV